MDGKDRAAPATGQNSICSLEWIAWAMEAARRHKEAEQLGTLSEDDVGDED